MILLAFVALGPGRLPADQQSAQKTLEAKGLKRSVSHFALPEEVEFNKQMKATETLKKKLTEAQHEAEGAAKKVDEKKKTIIAYLQKRRELRAQLNAARTVNEHKKGCNGIAALLVYRSEKPECSIDQFRLLRGQPALNDAAIDQSEHKLLPTTENGFQNMEFQGLFTQEQYEIIDQLATGLLNLAENLQHQMFQMKTNIWRRKDVAYLAQKIVGRFIAKQGKHVTQLFPDEQRLRALLTEPIPDGGSLVNLP